VPAIAIPFAVAGLCVQAVAVSNGVAISKRVMGETTGSSTHKNESWPTKFVYVFAKKFHEQSLYLSKEQVSRQSDVNCNDMEEESVGNL